MARLPGEQFWLSRPAPPPDPEREALVQTLRERYAREMIGPEVAPALPDAFNNK
jgi:hypothetical protein